MAGTLRQAAMPCREVLAYLRHEQRVPVTDRFDVNTIPNVDVAEYEEVMSAVQSAGYKLTAGVHVGFLTEPERQ